MAFVRKVLVGPGTYQAPTRKPDGTRALGKLAIDGRRIASWANKFAAMRAAGIRVPVCWGHQTEATPDDATEDEKRGKRQQQLAQWNAGYLEEMSVDPDDGTLKAVMDIPGSTVDGAGNLITETTLPDGTRVKSAIKEVSIAIRDWTDGSGRKWDDSIVHVALVTLPVMGGQSGFEAAEMATGEFHLSLAGLLEMGSGEATMPEVVAPETTGVAANRAVEPRISRTIASLQKAGIYLPEDTTEGNILERIDIACHAVEQYKAAQGVGDDPAGMDDAGVDDSDPDGLLGGDGEEEIQMDDGAGDDLDADGEVEDGEEMVDDMDADEGDEDGGEETLEGDSDDMPGEDGEDEEDEDDEEAEEEPRPMMMGTKGGKGGLVLRTPLEKALAKREAASVQAARRERVGRLIKKGLPRAQAADLLRRVEKAPIRLVRKGDEIKPVTESVDIELSTIEGVFASGLVQTPQGGAKRRRRPDSGARMSDKEMQAFITEQARSVSTNHRG